MWKNYTRAAMAASLWVMAVGLLVVATVTRQTILSVWAVMLALGGGVFTVWILLVVERTRTEDLARIAATAAIEHVRLHSVT